MFLIMNSHTNVWLAQRAAKRGTRVGVDLYHQWWYVHVLNTRGFVWTVSVFVLGVNILAPVLLWAVFRGKPLWNKEQMQLLKTFLTGNSAQAQDATAARDDQSQTKADKSQA